MGEQAETKRQRRETTRWVLQTERDFDGASVWFDAAVVEVPSGTRRRTVLLRAATEANLAVDVEGVKVRLVPMEYAVVSMLRPKPPTTPELEVI